jgi:hypothetical protein
MEDIKLDQTWIDNEFKYVLALTIIGAVAFGLGLCIGLVWLLA